MGGTTDKKQVIIRLNVTPELLQKFHAMPTCGTDIIDLTPLMMSGEFSMRTICLDEQKLR